MTKALKSHKWLMQLPEYKRSKKSGLPQVVIEDCINRLKKELNKSLREIRKIIFQLAKLYNEHECQEKYYGKTDTNVYVDISIICTEIFPNLNTYLSLVDEWKESDIRIKKTCRIYKNGNITEIKEYILFYNGKKLLTNNIEKLKEEIKKNKVYKNNN